MEWTNEISLLIQIGMACFVVYFAWRIWSANERLCRDSANVNRLSKNSPILTDPLWPEKTTLYLCLHKRQHASDAEIAEAVRTFFKCIAKEQAES